VKAIILSAGQGRRLLPLTAQIPKCLVEVCGRTLLEWQLHALADAAVKVVTVVVGFGADDVERHIIERAPSGMDVRTLVNPLWNRADNLVSCLAAHGEMTEDFLLINGDTLFEPAVVTRLCASRGNPVSLAVASKALYDDDDMKVWCDAGRVTRIGKDLPIDRVGGEAIGMSLYRGAGPRLLGDALQEVAGEPGADRRWYLSAVDRLARRGLVHAESVDDLGWVEIDYLHDLAPAVALTSRWDALDDPAATVPEVDAVTT
jgi:choline kinase